MLIDELMLTNSTRLSGADITPLLPRLRSAQKFILGSEFAAVAEALGDDYGGLVKAFPFCRLPYSECWFEVLQTDRPRFAASGIQLPEMQRMPKRVGFLCSATATDLSAWKIHLFWNFPHNERLCGTALAAMQCDTKNPIHHQTELPTPMVLNKHLQEIRSKFLSKRHIRTHPGWERASDEVKLIMSNHTSIVLPDYLYDMPAMTAEIAKMIGELCRSDWAGEVSFIMAVLGMLHARNATETETVDYTRLNKARSKSGKPPLFEHKILKIAQRQVRRVYPDGKKDSTHAPMRAHMVRGHWKVRRSGIYFWHPFIRGDLHRGKIDKDYQL